MRIRFQRDRHDAHHLAITTMVLMLACAASACQQKQAEQNNEAAVTQDQAEPSKEPAIKYHQGVGVIKEITPQDPSVSIKHEEIKDFMAAMTMRFHVKDKSLLDSLQPGDKIDFTIEDKQGIWVISEIKKKQ